jgi:hypothetical protein
MAPDANNENHPTLQGNFVDVTNQKQMPGGGSGLDPWRVLFSLSETRHQGYSRRVM